MQQLQAKGHCLLDLSTFENLFLFQPCPGIHSSSFRDRQPLVDIKSCLLPVLDTPANVDQTATVVLIALVQRLVNVGPVVNVVSTAIVAQIANILLHLLDQLLRVNVVLIALAVHHVLAEIKPVVVVREPAARQPLRVVKVVAARDLE